MRGANKWQAMAVAAGLVVASQAGAAEQITDPTKVAREAGSASGFGHAGQIVVSADASGFFGYNTGADALVLHLEPAADYFIQQNLSVGAAALVEQVFQDGPNTTALGVVVRAGYNLGVAEKVSLWPRVAFGPKFIHVSGGGSDLAFVLEGYLPALFHVTPHFFVGAGPQVRALISDRTGAGGSDQGAFSGHDVTIGISTTVGGYF
ncbi:hypothetical protein DRW03_17215 [Corallococcus sp. H22C18031201]|uniref:hypothetical protein n=1 Tax=Citreicoccus inhibens TaxID=2849499 RepID=UPI000E71F2F8|nr:hypothetical protein [Citreicoccus inhibens]MBU8897283.1 hypothetical protein [Citreicoccus inhibens]RJS21156.1 hypothetical protein DRW03_17215 [Corallococcus sp. H22C18031201]